MATTDTQCPKCRRVVQKDERGRIMMHTRPGIYNPKTQRTPEEPCEGATPGAKPASATQSRGQRR